MTNDEAKMVEEICTLQARLRCVTDFLESVLESGLPGKGRGQDDKESIEIWWEDRLGAIKRAREVLAATSEYHGVIVR